MYRREEDILFQFILAQGCSEQGSDWTFTRHSVEASGGQEGDVYSSPVSAGRDRKGSQEFSRSALAQVL